ncbi:MAG: DNA translocase FtsK 4TM domain-containing protein [Clostridia bacterium]|nr:DNA translocase FtsK 4TM domain-containing protein [Clostridia bacterium]
MAVALVWPGRGVILSGLARGLAWLLGRAAPMVPALCGAGGAMLLASGRMWPRNRGRLVGLALGTTVAAAWLHRGIPLDRAFARAPQGGGLVGATVWSLLARAFGDVGAVVVLVTGALLSLVLLFHVRPSTVVRAAVRALASFGQRTAAWFRDFFFEEVEDAAGAQAAAGAEPASLHEAAADEAAVDAVIPGVEDGAAPDIDVDEWSGTEAEDVARAAATDTSHVGAIDGPAVAGAPAQRGPRPAPETAVPAGRRAAPAGVEPGADRPVPHQLSLDDYAVYRLPPLDLLKRHDRRGADRRAKDGERGARALEETLASFGIQARVVGMDQGPAVTRYELQPAAGVKVSRIVSLADDIALALAATDVRIVAPIPGKSAVGIEVPNREIRTVSMREVLEHPAFQRSASRLTLALGEDVAGQPIVASLERMLHVLIAGATGSGKSVCLNTILTSILYKARPDEVKLLLVDPKRVELSVYNGIPHLMAPVITDPKQAAGALRWVQQEMVNRYELFADWGVRDIHRFNEQAAAKGRRPLPFIVVVIDELADLMLIAARDVEDAIQRLAQMARAAGIHLIVATQRPSVDVITGVIKANIPSRIAFAVSSQADSRTILDGAGAEKLLGKGDMLFYPIGAPKPVRAQGAYISEAELEAVLDFVRAQAAPEFNPEVLSGPAGAANDEDDRQDELFAEAVRVVMETRQASVSMLQRRLRVGFTRAGRLIDMMERRGFVGPHQGSKAREVLITPEMYERVFGASGGRALPEQSSKE